MTNVTAKGVMSIEWIASTPDIAVPVYQRDYRWTQDTCQTLLRDIRAIAQAPEGRTHFIGSILSTREGDGGVTLVDGQQRVATLMLVMAAIRDLAKGSDDALAGDVEIILRAPGDPSRARLQPHDRYVDVVRALMTATPTTPGESSFEQNYEFFIGELTDDWRQVWLGLQRLEHVAIELGAGANAQQIFESLNSTGARLSDDELIHNYIHMGRSREEQDLLERDVWLPIEDATVGATREFWRDYLVATSSTQPDFGGDFGVYKAFARRYPDPVRDLTTGVTAEWVRYANRYRLLLDPDALARPDVDADVDGDPPYVQSDPDVREQLRLIQMFEGGPRPLMLRVYDDFVAETIDKRTFVETSERLQSMWVRRAVVNLSQDIGTVGTICRDLQDFGYPIDGLVTRTPEDPRVRLALTHASVPYVGYVLRRIQKPPADAKDLQIEHIYPQTPSDEWSGDGGQTKWGELTNAQQAELRTVLNTIGNLTLLEAPLNQGAGNRPFLKKATKYYPCSLVPEMVELKSKTRWDHDAIKVRTAELIDRFLEIWARPSDVPMDTPDDLVRVVDLSIPYGMADPEIFEYVSFEGELWGDVHTIKELLARVGYTLWLRDSERFLATTQGGLVHKTRTPSTKYVVLPDGQLMYAAWATHYLLEAVQEALTTFGLDDLVRVKLLPSS